MPVFALLQLDVESDLKFDTVVHTEASRFICL